MEKFVLTFAALMASTALVAAAPIIGELEIGGGSNTVTITTVVPLTGTIGFFPGSFVLPEVNGTSGTFVGLVGQPVVFTGEGVPPTQLNFNLLANDNPLLTAGGLTFDIVNEEKSLTNIGIGQSEFSIVGDGLFHLAGFDTTPGIFDLSTQTVNGTLTNVSFSASASAVPGPIVGAGIPGLIAACVALLGLVKWRRRRITA